MKLVLKGLGILLLILVVAIGVLYFMGNGKVNATVDVPAESLAVVADSATLARGEYLVKIHACADCHGEGLSGQVMIDAPPFLASATNLTSGEGGIGGTYTDADWERAIRHGVGPGGRQLVPMMPSPLFNALADDEVAAMIAYLKTVPTVDNAELPASEVRPLGRILTGVGAFYMASTNIDQSAPHPAAAPAYAATVEYGEYRTTTICTYCHGADLKGGTEPVEPGTPLPPSLASVKGWSLDDFKSTMRTGTTPGGHEMNPAIMPWTAFAHMTDTELEALHSYLNTLSY